MQMGLSEKQTKAAEILATRAPGETIESVCERAGISQPTLWRYRQNEEFRAAVDRRVEELTWTDRGPVLRALAAKAKKGDVQAIRLFLQWRGELVEKHQVQNAGVQVIITDPELVDEEMRPGKPPERSPVQ